MLIGFSSKHRMAGKLLALLRVSHFKDTLRANIVVAKKYMGLKQLESLNCLLFQNIFWDLLFGLGRAVYSGMRILRLADLKTAGMDKLLHYVYQADRVTKKYLDDKKFGRNLDDLLVGKEDDEV